MNSINFDGVFSNMKLMPNDPQLLNHNNQHLSTLLSHQAGGGGGGGASQING